MKERIQDITKGRMRKLLFALVCNVCFWGSLLSVSVSSCTDDFPLYDYYGETYDGEERTLSVALSVAPMVSKDPQSRATTYIEATKEEKKIIDFWIIEYNEEGTRVGLPRFYKFENTDPEVYQESYEQDLKIIVPRDKDQIYTCVVIANTHDENLFNANNRSRFSTLDSLRNFDRDITNQEDLYDPYPKEEGHPRRFLLMSGWTKITRETTDLNVKLIRNVCKVNVKLTNFPDDDLVLKYYLWRDVPWGKLFPHGTKVNYHQPISRNWRDHTDYEPLRHEAGIDYWMPCNVWIPDDSEINGVSESGDDSEDTSEMQEDPTFFNIVCRRVIGKDASGNKIEEARPCEFTIYPSQDPEKQFKFEANHYYEIVIDVKSVPDPDVSPFFHMVKYRELPESNCYIIEPNSKDIFEVPLTQINKFWGYEINPFREAAIGLTADVRPRYPDMMLDDTSEWIAEVIWQDSDKRILDFVYLEGDEDPDLRTYEGIGNTFFLFRPTSSGEGNVVVGVRKKYPKELGEPNAPDIPPVWEREYLWSWHIWITYYQPDAVPDWIPGVYTTPVPGGSIIRGSGESWMANLMGVFIMDRNLGAYTNDWTVPNTFHLTTGMFYQYGRKDPFPYPDADLMAARDIDGNEIPEFNKPLTFVHIDEKSGNMGELISVRTTLLYSKNYEGSWENGVKHPYIYYTSEHADSLGWLSHCPHQLNTQKAGKIVLQTNQLPLWGHPADMALMEGDKSIFDPCPPGWTLYQSMGHLLSSVAASEVEELMSIPGTGVDFAKDGFGFIEFDELGEGIETWIGAKYPIMPDPSEYLFINACPTRNPRYGASEDRLLVDHGTWLYCQRFAENISYYGCTHDGEHRKHYGCQIRCVRNRTWIHEESVRDAFDPEKDRWEGGEYYFYFVDP